MKITDTQVLFWRTADIYSNWHPSEFTLPYSFDVDVRGFVFDNAEQALMFYKAQMMGDEETSLKILAAKGQHPNVVKQLGRQVKNWNEKMWVAGREQVMVEILVEKFHQNPNLEDQLLATGIRRIAEASPVDKIWGIGLEENDPRCADERQWQGLNLLGDTLEKTRSILLEWPA